MSGSGEGERQSRPGTRSGRRQARWASRTRPSSCAPVRVGVGRVAFKGKSRGRQKSARDAGAGARLRLQTLAGRVRVLVQTH